MHKHCKKSTLVFRLGSTATALPLPQQSKQAAQNASSPLPLPPVVTRQDRAVTKHNPTHSTHSHCSTFDDTRQHWALQPTITERGCSSNWVHVSAHDDRRNIKESCWKDRRGEAGKHVGRSRECYAQTRYCGVLNETPGGQRCANTVHGTGPMVCGTSFWLKDVERS